MLIKLAITVKDGYKLTEFNFRCVTAKIRPKAKLASIFRSLKLPKHQCTFSVQFTKGANNLFYQNLALPENISTCHRLNSTNTAECYYDICIVGGGIVGAATAMKLSEKYPNLKLCLLEKEDGPAKHQSGHNSGVVHAGIYYKPGSLKAKLCVEGLHLSYAYFNQNHIPYKKCGKLIVAVTQDEIPRLKDLFERGLQNNVPNLKMIPGDKIKDIEPHCKGLMAIWSPETGIVDWAAVTRSYVENFIRGNGKVFFNFDVTKFKLSDEVCNHPVMVFSSRGKCLKTKFVLTCGGLHSDRLAELTGCDKDPKIVPFRGEYLLLCPEKSHLVRGNIYPVPDPRFPFLGVHFTPRMDGSVWLGPNAVLAFKREGYRWCDLNIRDLSETVFHKGFLKLASQYATYGAMEMVRSAFIGLQLKELQKYISSIGFQDISRGPTGVRAQAISPEGNLVDDFVFDSGKGDLAKRVLHVRNAPSPGATSSLAIAKMIVDRVGNEFAKL